MICDSVRLCCITVWSCVLTVIVSVCACVCRVSFVLCLVCKKAELQRGLRHSDLLQLPLELGDSNMVNRGGSTFCPPAAVRQLSASGCS